MARAKKPELTPEELKAKVRGTFPETVLTAMGGALVVWFLWYNAWDNRLLFLAMCGLAFVVEVVSYHVSYYVGSFISRRWGKGDLLNASESAMNKFRQQSWEMVVHTALTVYNFWIMYQTDWMWLLDANNTTFREPWTEKEMAVKEHMRWYYMIEMAVWTVQLVEVRFFNEVLKDYFAMLSHHVTTVAISWYADFTRIGVLVLTPLDSSDIICDLLKMTNRAGLDAVATVLFIVNLVTWAISRLYIMPFITWRSTLFYAYPFLEKNNVELRWWYWWSCNTLLGVLVFLMVYCLYNIVTEGVQTGRQSIEGDDLRGEEEKRKKKEAAAKSD